MAERNDDIRQVTPAIAAGVAAGVAGMAEVEPAPGLEGSLYAFGKGAHSSTVVLTRVRSSVAFIPALVCRDRATTPSRPEELPAERWEELKLESAGFNSRYMLLGLEGQDPGLVRELFSPSLIAWLERDPPTGFAFELNEGYLAVVLPGHVEGQERERLVEMAGEVSTRIAAEIAEEGEASLDVFSEAEELRDLETAIADVAYVDPPESVQTAISQAKVRASRKPATLLKAVLWGVVAGGIAAGIALALGGPALAGVAAAVVGIPALYLGWLVGRASYRWGVIGVERVGLQAWAEGFASSRGLRLEDRWRFHATHKDLPMPGFADHVLEGTIPGSDLRGRLLFLGDAAELRTAGQEIAYVANRPLASTAILVESERELPTDASSLELPEEYSLEIHGRHILIWRPVQGNLVRTSEGTGRFCERATGVVSQMASKD